MRQIFAYDTLAQHDAMQQITMQLMEKLTHYEARLRTDFELHDAPNTIIWSSAHDAMNVFSNVPVPAYTNERGIFMTPSVDEWRDFYRQMLAAEPIQHHPHYEDVRQFFESLTVDDVCCIVAHELTHHIELFPDDFDDARESGIWFEEGMCEYLSQRLTLSDARYNEQYRITHMLVDMISSIYPPQSLDSFGVATYEHTSLAAIMQHYWRSHIAVHTLVEQHYDGDARAALAAYNDWHHAGRTVPLTQFFHVQ